MSMAHDSESLTLTWVERSEIFARQAQHLKDQGDLVRYSAAMLSVKVCQMMAVEEGEVGVRGLDPSPPATRGHLRLVRG